MSETLEDSSELVALVGSTIRQLRAKQKVSVTDLARKADVSRRMLTAIEGGNANASLVTLDKIARALGVDFSVLVRSRAETPIEVVHDEDAKAVWAGAVAGSSGRVFVTSHSHGAAELWDWTLGPRDRYDAEPDPEGSEEILLVTRGELALAIGNDIHIVPTGSVARIATDRSYSYINPADASVHFVRIVVINQA
ncbi:helix-turn-helix domain-containing protein [Arthrobacter sp. TmT3-37]